MVPHLITALTGPLLDLEKKILDATPTIERWFRLEWQDHTPPFYCSVDLRNSGFKLAPVDTNLFPGGFNNLSNEMLPLAVQAAMASIENMKSIHQEDDYMHTRDAEDKDRNLIFDHVQSEAKK